MKKSLKTFNNFKSITIIYRSQILVILSLLLSTSSFAQNGVGINTTTPVSSFEVNGSVGNTVTTVTVSTTLNANHHIVICNNASTAITITLPTANAVTGRNYQIKRNETSTANVTISGTIDGVSNRIITNANEAINLVSDGVEWKTLTGNSASGWALNGNAGTSSATNFIGTTTGQALKIRTNNTEKMTVNANGFVGVGITDPTARMVIKDTLEIRRVGTQSQLLFTNTIGSGDFRIGGDGGDIHWQGGGGRNLQMGSFWATILGGDRQITGFPAYGSRIGGTGVLVLGQRNASVPLGIQAFSGSQTANLTEWRNSSNTVLSSVNPSGHLAIGNNNPTSNLQTVGSFAKGYIAPTGNLTLTGSHSTILANNGAIAITLTLPAGNTCQGRVYEIKKPLSSIANVTLAGTIDGVINLVLSNPGESVILVSDGTNWISHSRSIPSSSVNSWSITGNASSNPSTNFIGTSDAQDFVLRTNNVERLRLLSNGNLNIGTASSSTTIKFHNYLSNRKLSLWEDFDNEHQFYGLGINPNRLRYQIANTTDSHSFFAGTSSTTSNELMRLNGNGTLSLGNTQNTNKFHIYETVGTVATINNGTIVLEHGNVGGSSSIMFKSTVNPSTDFAHITYSEDGSGNGTSNENGLLTIGIQNDIPGSPWVDDIALMPSGFVGINTIAPDAMLSVNGDASKIGGGSWATFSDRRLKKDINLYTDGLAKLLKINPVTFKYNGKGPYSDTTTEYVGVIAQEIQDVVSYTVDTVLMKLNKTDSSPTSLLSYDPSSLTYLTINAIKEQQLLIENLQKQVAKLLIENEILEDKQTRDLDALRDEFTWMKAMVSNNKNGETVAAQK